MSDIVNPQEEPVPLAAATTGDHPSRSRYKRCSSPDDDDQLVKKSKKQQPPKKKSKKQLFNCLAPTSRPSTSDALRRTISDPLPYAQLFKKLQDGMKELSVFLEQIPQSEIMSQEEQSQVISETDAPNALLPCHRDGEDLGANNSDVSVSVEKTGDCLNIHVRCPCGKRYHFILCQGSCFYKLM